MQLFKRLSRSMVALKESLNCKFSSVSVVGCANPSLIRHAGCYCMCDLQQCATSLVSYSQVAISVLGRVVSVYPLRKEAMCDVGALSVSKDTGRFPGFGRVVKPDYATGWDLGRISQEHGTLVHRQGKIIKEENELKIGDSVQIIPQHACLVCACFPWLYVVDDGGDEVVDVWVPWKGW